MMDAEDKRLFEDSLRKATATQTDEALDAALDELGWHDALTDDGMDAVALLFRLQGAANATSSAIDDVLLLALGLDVGGTAAVVLPSIGRYDAPGTTTGVQGIGTARVTRATNVVVVSATADGHGAAVVSSDQLTVRPVAGIDPALGLVEVQGNAVMADTEVDWAAAVAAGQVALAHELVGAATTMLQLARDHAVQRIQFGRAIASFQAVRHRLADALVSIESADAAVTAARTDVSPLAAGIAKAVAGRAAHTTAGHAQQVLGGMGFTTEHPLHRYIKRAFALDQLLGSSQRLTKEIGERILRGGQLPAMLPL